MNREIIAVADECRAGSLGDSECVCRCSGGLTGPPRASSLCRSQANAKGERLKAADCSRWRRVRQEDRPERLERFIMVTLCFEVRQRS